MASEKVTVKALYKFKASNNDELSFKKGDLITVAQTEDGGWWEGTCHESGKTGWFPSNYVKQVEEKSISANVNLGMSNEGGQIGGDLTYKQEVYRSQLVAELIDKEQDFIQELKNLFSKYLEPIKQGGTLLTDGEFNQLVGNVEEIIDVHSDLHQALVEETSKDPPQRVGRVLLGHGAMIKSAHEIYWANHPKKVCIFEKHREALDKFMEAQGASKPGLMILTTGLSRPFRHLERYASLMQEIEQHLTDDHPDRGDTQRSIGFFKNMASECARLRRQKELELEVLSGSIRGWEGEQDISTLGDILQMGSVAVGPDHKDRYFVLFHNYLLILSVSSRMSAFIYEGKLPLSGVGVNRLEDTETIRNSFEITGAMIDRIVCICQSKTESLRWVEVLKEQIKVSKQSFNYPGGNPLPPPHKPPPPSSPMTAAKNKEKVWKMSCIRPAPPTRSFLQSSEKNNVANGPKKKDSDTTYEEDLQILKVIEAYCANSTAKQRQTFASSAIIESPHQFAPEEDGPTSDDKDVTEMVKYLREQLRLVKGQNRALKSLVEEEIAARKRLEQILKNNLFLNRTDIEWND